MSTDFLSKENRYWSVNRPSTPDQYRKHFIKRFWSWVDKTPGLGPQGDCWEWQGSKVDNGYGQMGAMRSKLGLPGGDNQPLRAHVAAWIVIYGNPVPPKGWHVCHECNNKICVRKEHLWAGTPADNVHHAQATGLVPKVDREEREAQRMAILDAQAKLKREFIDRHLHLVKPKAQDVLKRRYGYTYDECQTLQQIGDDYGTTREWIRQIQEGAEVAISMITIEKDIPIPGLQARSQATQDIQNAFESMDIGDSFTMPYDHSRQCKVGAMARARGYLVTIRKQPDGLMRVWMVSKGKPKK